MAARLRPFFYRNGKISMHHDTSIIVPIIPLLPPLFSFDPFDAASSCPLHAPFTPSGRCHVLDAVLFFIYGVSATGNG